MDVFFKTEYLITQILAFAPNLSKGMPRILQAIAEDLGWSFGAFWKVNKENKKIICQETWVGSDVDVKEFLDETLHREFSLGEGLTGIVYKSGLPYWVTDVATANLPRSASAIKGGLCSAFAFPIMLGEEVLGVIEFFSQEIKSLDQDALQVFDAIGSQLGQFIERKQTEEALLESQQQFKLALQAARMGYWSWDLQTNVVRWSENLEPMHGLQKGAFGGTFDEFSKFVHPDDRKSVQQNIQKAIDEHLDYHIEFRIVWPDGSIHWIHGRGQVFYNPQGKALRMLGFAIDITDRKTSEKALQLAYEEMERRVQERTLELFESNQILEAEIMERKKVEEEILEISLKEQRRFGSQLHDGVCQNLAGILMITKVLAKKMEKKGSEEVDELKKIAEMLHQAVGQARDMARGLYPVELEGASLMRSLEDLTSRSQSLLNINVHFECPQPIYVSDNNAATHFYRIAQEAIGNAAKHGSAQNVEVSLFDEGENIVLKIKDDGNGLMNELKNSKGIGLHIMKYRARMLSADLQIGPNEPHGTILTCSMKKSEEDKKVI